MRRSHLVFAATTALALVGGVSACGGDDSSAPAAVAATSGAAPSGASTKEVTSVSAVRPKIDALTTALQNKDLAASRTAYADYDAAWNGVEVYVNIRDLDLYETLEQKLQDPIGEALDKDTPDFAALVPTAQKLGTSFDQAIANSKKGPALSPLVDDVTALRVVRSDLRRATAEVDDLEVDDAKGHFTTFASNYPSVQSLVTARSDTADGQIAAAISAAQKEFSSTGPSAVRLDPLLENVTARYNYAVSLLNVAARNADVSRTAVAQSDVDAARTLHQAGISLQASAKAWTAGDYAAAKTAATAADTTWDKAAPALQSKKNVPDVDELIDAYLPEAAKAGDKTKVPADAQAAIEAVQVAEQALVGQFWTDPAVKSALAG